MYFLHNDTASLSSDPLDNEEWSLITKQLSLDKSAYLHFGPYWWSVKRLLRKRRGARGAWFTRSYEDRELESVSSDDEPTIGLALAYRARMLPDRTPPHLHIVELHGEAARWYRLTDPDTEEQLDLFENAAPDLPHARDAADFSATPWLRLADGFADGGDNHRAAGALLRAVERAIDREERNRGLLRLGEVFRDAGHFRKALLCYRDAIERGRESWIHGLMGEVYLEIGNPAEALAAYEHALSAMPGNPEYRFGYERARSELEERGVPILGNTV